MLPGWGAHLGMQEWLLLFVLPFSYGAATRVPFVFAGLHLRSLFMSTPLISALLGCYQLSRVAGNCMVQLLGQRTSLVVGAACGLLGYAALASSTLLPAAEASSSSSSSSSTTQLAWLASCLALVGLSEQITSLQIICKQRYRHTAGTIRTRLLQQYASNVCGTCVAFFFSGLAYTHGGLPLAAAAGALFEAKLLLGSAWYLATEPAERCAAASVTPQAKQDKPAAAAVPCCAPDDASVDARVPNSRRGDTPSWISLVVAITFAVQALLIGTILSTGPLLVADAMGFSTWHVGLTFAAGEALGSLALLTTSTPAGQATIRSILPMPLCLLTVLAAMSCTALLFPLVTSHKVLSLACLALVMGLNDVGTSMSGECQGATLPERHYHSVNIMGNTLRRMGNTVTCVCGPLLYQLHPALPFVLFGCLTLLWTCALSALFAQRARECAAEDVSCIARRSPWSAAHLAAAGITGGLLAGSHLTGLEHYLQLSFVSQEQRFWAQADSQPQQSMGADNHVLWGVLGHDTHLATNEQLGKGKLVQRSGKHAQLVAY